MVMIEEEVLGKWRIVEVTSEPNEKRRKNTIVDELQKDIYVQINYLVREL
jgi:hypothetical protein